LKMSRNQTSDVTDYWPPRLEREMALKEIDLRLSKEPSAVELRFGRARLLTELGHTEEAKHAYLDLLALAPAHFGALNNLGALLHSTGFKTAARTCYAEAAMHHPDNPTGHVNLANVLLENEEWELTREHYETALRLVPDHAEAHQGMANLLRGLGHDEAAETHRRAGFQNRSVTILPYRGCGRPGSCAYAGIGRRRRKYSNTLAFR
jgi:tetratricopeptide (TPR) repeat protein